MQLGFNTKPPDVIVREHKLEARKAGEPWGCGCVHCQRARDKAKSRPRKPVKARKPGVVLRTLSLDVQIVRSAHRKECASCGTLPEIKRLVVTLGAGRSGKSAVLCSLCGSNLLTDISTTVASAADNLSREGGLDEDLRVYPLLKDAIPPMFVVKKKVKQ